MKTGAPRPPRMWGWIAFLGGSAAILLWMSRDQPFPEVGARWGWLMLCVAGVLAMGMSSPRATHPGLPALLSTGIGGLATVLGVRHMAVRKDDVLTAPFASLWLAAGVVSMLSEGWMGYGRLEQIAGFVLATFVVLLAVFLLWKGLIIGVQGITWSQAALRQLERGLLEGDRGSVAMFEKSWAVEESWLDAMSHAALVRIHAHRGDAEAEAAHAERLERLGGMDAVDEAWVLRVDACLRALRPVKDEPE